MFFFPPFGDSIVISFEFFKTFCGVTSPSCARSSWMSAWMFQVTKKVNATEEKTLSVTSSTMRKWLMNDAPSLLYTRHYCKIGYYNAKNWEEQCLFLRGLFPLKAHKIINRLGRGLDETECGKEIACDNISQLFITFTQKV